MFLLKHCLLFLIFQNTLLCYAGSHSKCHYRVACVIDPLK